MAFMSTEPADHADARDDAAAHAVADVAADASDRVAPPAPRALRVAFVPGVMPEKWFRRYRERTGIAAKLVVVAMASNGFTIADPDDGGMLDVVGFDAGVPEVIAGFAGGG